MMRRWHIIVFTILLGVIIGLSSTTLYTQSIRLDESQSIWAATKPVSAIMEYTAGDVHVPLYNILLHFWVQLFGTDIILARTLSLLFFIATLPVLFKLAREAASTRVAVVTVALFALSPFVSWYSNEARMYTLLTFVTSLNHLYFMRLNRSEGHNGRWGYAISAAVGLYTHYFFLLVLASQGIYVLLIMYRQARLVHDETNQGVIATMWQQRNLLWRYGLLLLPGLALFVLWVAYVIHLGSIGNTEPLLGAPSSYNILQILVQFIFGFQTITLQSLLVSLWPLLVLLIFFIFTRKKERNLQQAGYITMVTFVPIALAFVASYIRPVFLSRYLIFTTPTLFLLLAALLMSYPKKLSTILASSILALMFGLMLFQNTSAATPVKENYQAAREYVENTASPQDIIAVSSPFTIYPMEYDYNGPAKMTTIPEWDRYAIGAIPSFTPPKLASQIAGYAQQYQKLYLVLSYDQGYQQKIQTYLDNHFKLLQTRQFSTDVQLRVYQLRY